MLNCTSKSSHGRMEPYHIGTTERTGTHHWMHPLFHIVHTKKIQFIHRVLKQSGKFFLLSILLFPPIRLQKKVQNHQMTETTSLNPRTHKPSISQSKSAKPTSDSAATSRFPALFISRKSRTWKINTQITKNI